MPAIIPMYDPNNKEMNTAADKERRERLQLIKKRRAYYNGDHDKPLKVQPMQRDNNIILNLAGQTVDKTVDFLGVPSFSIKGDVGEEMQATLQSVIKAAELEYLVPDLVTSGMIAGHYYLRIIAPDEGEPSLDNLPRLALISPDYMTVFWDAGLFGMRDSALFCRLEWEFGDEQRRQGIVPVRLLPEGFVIPVKHEPLLEDGWVILEYAKSKKRGTSRNWEIMGADSWPYPFPPIADGKNRRKPHSYYGESDLKDLRMNDAVNFIASNTGQIIKYHAQPRTILFGADAGQIQGTTVDGLWTIPNENARAENLEMQSDLMSSMNFLQMLRSSWFTQSRVVDMASVKEKVGQLTNFGLRMLFSDMIAMTDEKRKRYGKSLETAFERIMFMITGEEVDLMHEWPDPLPENRIETVKTVGEEKVIGVTSPQTLANDLGRDYKKEYQQRVEVQAQEIDLKIAAQEAMVKRGAFGNGDNQ